MKHTALALTLAFATTSVAADPAGLRMKDLAMPHHGADAGVAIWYPNGGGGTQTVYAENPVFQGVEAAMGATVSEGKFPVILFSHGMGGTSRTQAWLASALADRGAIVMFVNHANSTWGDFDMTKGVHHWTRAADLSVALDALMADPKFSGHIDTSRIMAAGFSYGGWTALSMGGLSGNHAGTVEACQTHIDTMEACEMLLSEGVNMPGIDPNTWNADYSDSRITHVTAIDPGFVWGLEAGDAEELVPNVLMIGLGGSEDRMQATDFDTSGLAGLLDQARIERIDPGFHFTAMPLCKPEGEAILIEEKDDPVCTDPVGTDREGVHAAIVQAMAVELGL